MVFAWLPFDASLGLERVVYRPVRVPAGRRNLPDGGRQPSPGRRRDPGLCGVGREVLDRLCLVDGRLVGLDPPEYRLTLVVVLEPVAVAGVDDDRRVERRPLVRVDERV